MERMKRVMVAGLAASVVWAQDTPGVNCTFRDEPDRFLNAQARAVALVQERLDLYGRSAASRQLSVRGASVDTPPANTGRTVDANEIPQRNFIDVQILGRMSAAGVRSAPLSDDYEFVRRIYLDLTGRIPTPDQIRAFAADANPRKRDDLIDTLLYSPEFSYKWQHWLGDLMQNASSNSFRNLNINGRNEYHAWLLRSLNDPSVNLRDIVFQALTAKGNNYVSSSAPANWSVRSSTGGGPAQDTYDTAFSRAATQFLGMGHYDCILCHDGRGHLDLLSVWGRTARRTEAQRMSAFFARLRFVGNNDATSYFFQSTEVNDATAGTYDLNTNFGNRPDRVPVGSTRNLTPEYRLGGAPTNTDWRGTFADSLLKDPMLTRNLANRIWKQVFNMGLVEPVDQLDPARLDPKNPPAAPWTLQATHPELLEALAENLVGTNFSLREFVRVLVSSSSYQLSSRYDDSWKIDFVPMFARHYPRRMEGEEVHDAIQLATGVLGTYTVQGWTEPVRWALQFPEPVEPRSNGGVANFMNAFFRGNRDGVERLQLGSILQQLNLMNDTFVTNRVRVANSANLRRIAGLPNATAIPELYLTFLSRLPNGTEQAKTARYLDSRGAANRNASFEDLAWALTNRTEFIFSY
ncbi:MAG: DUF1553 domain-containing protein [Acidobacteria bacterium]|nr:DUF1553 domain-containing protein [Acidobacteriota bacterium]